MTKPEINISVKQNLNICLNENQLQEIVLKTLEIEGIVSAAEMGLVITDNKTIQKLNRTYRGDDKSTDVLAFHMVPSKNQEVESPFVDPPDGIHHLGEVVISYPQAVKQAQQQGNSIERELSLLIVHGVLHLLGYDHELPHENQQMRAKENKILEVLDFT
ncbi:MAG: rRNA maturation RNase YbeY [Chloroflexota bacterium]|nr:MAG: rRNA maturation RNase YbeY [Chloroflexota bacterium]